MHTKPSDYVTHTSTGGKHNPSNLRREVLGPGQNVAALDRVFTRMG
jgi:hypothetical protein